MTVVICCICGHSIKGPLCPHPWSKPLSEWPKDMLAQLKDVLDGV